jgi:hypothetical protein
VLCMRAIFWAMVADSAAKPAGYTWSSLMDARINPAKHEFDRLAVDVN